MRAAAALFGAIVCALWLPACAGAPLVERAYGGRVVYGRAIEPEAYAAFLNGAIAEAAGEGHAALAFYARATRFDPVGPETWTRVGAVRCALDPRDRGADDAFGRALAIDPRSAGLWSAKARCASARGDPKATVEASRRASDLDSAADGANALLASTAGAIGDAAPRDELVALTETASDRATAWDALASWAKSRGDVALWALALERLAKAAPARRDAVARASEELAGVGQIGAARAVAAVAVDSGDGPFAEERHPLAARLAVDEAIARGDESAARLRATRARVGLEEAGARACLSGRTAVARALVSGLARANPADVGARLVLAACDKKDLVGSAWEARHFGGRASAAALVAFGLAAGQGVSMQDTRAALAAIEIVEHAPIVPGDDLVVRAGAELASRGLFDARMLPPDGVLELTVLRGDTAVEGAAPPDAAALDARHEYLALALADPGGTRTKQLSDRLKGVAWNDPVVAAADAFVQMGIGVGLDAGAARALLARAPGDPLIAATALRLADRTGDMDAATRARATLADFVGLEVRAPAPGRAKAGTTF